MFASIKILVSLILLIAGGASIFVAYKKWVWVMKMIFGRERVENKGTNMVSIYLYVAGGILIFLALLVIA
jgi:hypothetical protein